MGLESIFSDGPCANALSDEQLLAAMARFEGALALASARAGHVPQDEAQVIAKVCAAARFDVADLARRSRSAGTLAIPFVEALRDQVAAVSGTAAKQVHAGATSQDVMDTGVALCLRQACRRIEELAVRTGKAAAELSRRYAATPMVARTLLQPALPTTFGLKSATWLSMLSRGLPKFRAAAAEACVLQFGGPAGTLSAFGPNAAAIEQALASELGLPLPAVPWHPARDAFARLGAELALLAGAAGKIGRDVSLLMQKEVAEVAEPSPGGSSSMAHKRNPAASLLALEGALRAPGLAATLLAELTPEHERGVGQWQSQWFTLRDLAGAASSGLAAMAETLEGLQVDAQAMRSNLERARLPEEELRRGAPHAQALIARALAQWDASSRGT